MRVHVRASTRTPTCAHPLFPPHLQLKRRQDLFSTLASLLTPAQDTIVRWRVTDAFTCSVNVHGWPLTSPLFTQTIDMPISGAMPPVAFAIARRREARAVHAETTDLKDLASVVAVEQLPSGFPRQLVGRVCVLCPAVCHVPCVHRRVRALPCGARVALIC